MKYKGKYRIPPARLIGWDYRTTAPYFVTICTAHRQHYFGKIVAGSMQFTTLGMYANERISKMAEFSAHIELINHVVMPNHVHLLLELQNDTQEHQPNRFGPLLKKSLSSAMNHYKGRVTKFANSKSIAFGWQTRFHDHIVRDSDSYQTIFDYITNNPQQWNTDCHNLYLA